MSVADARDEATLNRLLRRADWRFLLPNPRPSKSVCFADGTLARAVATITTNLIEPGVNTASDCDLAVAINPTKQKLQAAWSELRPGGAFYTEWHSPLAGGPGNIRRYLEAAGFTGVACYWPWPWPDRAPALFWLPLEAPHVVHYFLAHRTYRQFRPSRAWNRLLTELWISSLKLRLLVPVCVIAQKPPVKATNSTGDGSGNHAVSTLFGENVGLLDAIRAGWSDWNSDPPPRHLDWFLLTRGGRTTNKVVGMVFAESERYPRLIVKLSRVAESDLALNREAANLRVLQASQSAQVRGVPRILFSREWAGHQVLGETVLTGRPLYTLLRRDNGRELALRVTDWLAALIGHATPCSRLIWWDRLIRATIDEFERNFNQVIESEQLRETRAVLDTLGDLPLVCEHRDCSPWNVLLSADGSPIVLDWEGAEPRGLPLLDLHYFLTYCAFFMDDAMDSGRYRESYRMVLDPTTPTGRVMFECEKRYLAQLCLDYAILRPLRILTWLIHSRSEYKRLIAETAGQLDSSTLRRSLFVSLWKEELVSGDGHRQGH